MFKLSNSSLLLIVSGIAGAAVNLNFISATSYFLTLEDPSKITLLVSVVMAVFTVFLHTAPYRFFKFSNSIAIISLCYGVGLIALSHDELPQLTRAYTWLFLALLARILYKWIGAELAVRYLNPAAAKAHFSYMNITYEAATLAVMLVLFTFSNINPSHIMMVCGGLYLAYFVVVTVFFMPARNVENKLHSASEDPQPAGHKSWLEALSPLPPKILVVFVISAFAFGTMEALVDYTTKSYFKEYAGDYGSLTKILAAVSLVSSAVLIIISPLFARLEVSRRPPPIILQAIYCIINAALALFCMYSPSMESFLILAIGFVITTKGIYVPSDYTLMTFFPSRTRQKLSAIKNFFYWVVASLAVFTMVPLVKGFMLDAKIAILLCCIIQIAYVLTFLIYKYRSQLLAYFYDIASQQKKVVSVLAVEGLSYLRPKDYGERMQELLLKSPKKLLRKSIILGLGYAGSERDLEHMAREFQSDKEEIQLAVIDALNAKDNYLGAKFTIEILLGKKVAVSKTVRFSAARVLGKIYGDKAIPILLLGLNEAEDYRTIANTLEVLATFRKPALIAVFKEHINSPDPRTRANALMGLIVLPRQKLLCRQKFMEMLDSETPTLIAPALYAVGLLRDSVLFKKALEIASSPLSENYMVKRCLAWALSRYNNPLGKKMFIEIFEEGTHQGGSKDFLHFYSQISEKQRYDILEDIIKRNEGNEAFFKSLYQRLKFSAYDFHNELSYLKLQTTK